MLDLMIGNDPRAFSLGEIHAWFRTFRSHHFNIIPYGKEDCLLKQLKSFRKKVFCQKFCESLDADILLDSSKNLPWLIDNNICEIQNSAVIYNLLLYKNLISLN
jgi:hypothetical protein